MPRFKKNNPGCTCCEEGDCCDQCECQTPLSWKVTILGKEYILPMSALTQLGDPIGDHCWWMLAVDEVIDCAHVSHITLNMGNGVIQLELRDHSTGSNILRRRWFLTVGEPFDCTGGATSS